MHLRIRFEEMSGGELTKLSVRAVMAKGDVFCRFQVEQARDHWVVRRRP
jgi:hypothetical protein